MLMVFIDFNMMELAFDIIWWLEWWVSGYALGVCRCWSKHCEVFMAWMLEKMIDEYDDGVSRVDFSSVAEAIMSSWGLTEGFQEMENVWAKSE